jgi:hypothetical protein
MASNAVFAAALAAAASEGGTLVLSAPDFLLFNVHQPGAAMWQNMQHGFSE